MTTHTERRLTAYATAHALSREDTIEQLVTIALEHLDARSAAGKLAHKGTTKAERSASASKAATARWDREKGR